MAINWYKIGQMPLWRMNIKFGITMMNLTQCEGLSIQVDLLNDELNDHWTQTKEEYKIRIP